MRPTSNNKNNNTNNNSRLNNNIINDNNTQQEKPELQNFTNYSSYKSSRKNKILEKRKRKLEMRRLK